MLRNRDGNHSPRALATALVVMLAALACAGPAAAGPLSGSAPLAAPALPQDAAAPRAAAAPISVAKAGLRVSKATLTGRALTVRIRAARATTATFTVLSGSRAVTSVRGRVAKGTRTLKLTLPLAPSGRNLALRVSTRVGRRTARSTFGLLVTTPTAPSGPGTPTPVSPTTPTTTTPTTTTTTTTTTTPPPPDPKLTLTPTAIAENQPSGTTVGGLAAVDAPTVGAAPQFTLVSGTGSTDNAAFTIDGTTLKTAQQFDYEVKKTYAIRVRAQDGGAVETPLTVTVTDVNEQPVAGSPQVIGSSAAFLNTTLVVTSGRSAATVTGGPQRTVSGDLLTGATDPDGDPLTTVAGTTASAQGAAVTIEADGDFVYRPPAGCASGGLDTFDFTISDGRGGTDVSTATVERKSSINGPCPWYVDASAPPGGTGTSSAPFTSLSSLNGVSGPDDADDEIFIAAGTYAGPFTLESGQKLHTAQHGLTTFGSTLAAPNPAATTTLSGGTLTVGQNNTIQGLNLGTSSGLPALAGSVTGTLTMNTVTPGAIDNPQGAAVDLTGGTLNVALSKLSSTNASGGSPNAIRLNGTGGTFTAATGSVQNASGTTVVLTGTAGSGAVNFTYGGSVVDSSGTIVDINNQGAGTKDFNGQLFSLSTDGVTLGSNTGATIRFDGGMTLQRQSSGPALNATGGGTLAISDPPGSTTNALRALAGSALNVNGVTIAPDGLTFATLGGAGATNGIVLSGTGASGGLTVLSGGSGLENGGGVISGMSGPGVSLTNVGGPVSLSGMTIQNGTDDGVRADNVASLTITASTLTTNGDSAADHGVDLTTGASATGTKRLTVTNSQVTGSATAVGRGIVALATGTATLKASIQTMTFSGIGPQSIAVETTNDLSAAPTIEAEVKNNTIGSATARSGSISEGAVSVRAVGRGQVRADVLNNTLQQYARGIVLEQTHATTYTTGAKGRLDVRFSGNALSNPNTTDNPNADGVQVNAGAIGGDAGTLCLDLGANALASASAGGNYDLRARKAEASDLLLPSFVGSSQDAAAATSYLSARVGGGIDVLAEDVGTGGFLAGACIPPTMG